MYNVADLAKVSILVNGMQSRKGKTMARIQINDLQAKEKELSESEMNDVVGGSIRFRRFRRYRYARRQVGYRYVSVRKRVPVYRRIRYVQTNIQASGIRYGAWRRG